MTVVDPELCDRLRAALHGNTEVEIAVLVGSRRQGTARPNSDWDIACFFRRRSEDALQELQRVEHIRCQIAEVLGVIPEKIDLIDLSRARLAMKALVADDGLVLKGDDTSRWFRFLQQTWRELEDVEWEKTHAA